MIEAGNSIVEDGKCFFMSYPQIMSTIINDRLWSVMVCITSAGCIHKFPTVSIITHIFVFTTRFFMLFWFLTTAQTFMFLNTFFLFFDLNSILISSLKIWLISLLIPRLILGRCSTTFPLICYQRREQSCKHRFYVFSFLHLVKDKKLFCKYYL